MDPTVIKTEPPDQSNQVIKEEIVEMTPSTPTIVLDGSIVERAEQPLLSQNERNQRQMNEDESLINSVQKFPIIYDRTNPNYQNKEQVRHVWSVIAENANRTPDYCHKRWRYLRDYFVRQLRYHRTTDPSKLKRPWVLFNKLTFLIPFVAHVVDKNNSENCFDVANGYVADMKVATTQLHDYLSKFQTENYYECDGTEINDLTMELNADTVDEEDDIVQPHHSHQSQQGHLSQNKKRKANIESGSSFPSLEPLDRKPYETMSRLDNSLDEHDHFLYSLAPELRKIDSKFTLHFRNEVHNLILKYQSMSVNDE
ncbi:uncharacterized protein LOC119072599 [Bradysia coprophila]|uniref:uncharacterized protein LOC119072599 n=1 Tax=Bradysia coprophila TaxID=38358 RepID=UPI00187D9FA8|nr:uncharacterized protein LOC119072599 [Bradysia coprophila]